MEKGTLERPAVTCGGSRRGIGPRRRRTREPRGRRGGCARRVEDVLLEGEVHGVRRALVVAQAALGVALQLAGRLALAVERALVLAQLERGERTRGARGGPVALAVLAGGERRERHERHQRQRGRAAPPARAHRPRRPRDREGAPRLKWHPAVSASARRRASASIDQRIVVVLEASCFRGARYVPSRVSFAHTERRIARPSAPIFMATLRAEIIFVAALAAFASFAPVARADFDAPRRPSPSLDVSVLRRSLLASGSAAADASRADGALSLLDGLFADARAARASTRTAARREPARPAGVSSAPTGRPRRRPPARLPHLPHPTPLRRPQTRPLPSPHRRRRRGPRLPRQRAPPQPPPRRRRRRGGRRAEPRRERRAHLEPPQLGPRHEFLRVRRHRRSRQTRRSRRRRRHGHRVPFVPGDDTSLIPGDNIPVPVPFPAALSRRRPRRVRRRRLRRRRARVADSSRRRARPTDRRRRRRHRRHRRLGRASK